MSAKPSIRTATCRAPCSPRGDGRRLFRRAAGGLARRARPGAARTATSPPCSARPSRRSSAASARRRRSGSSCSTCSTARCSRSPAPRGRLSQLSDDGLLPRFLGWRLEWTDCPWVATRCTAGSAIIFLLIGDPIWMIAAANFTYLIGICMPNVAAWLLRRDLPDAPRPYRAPRGTIVLGVAAASVWLLTAILGFQQFGLPTVLFALALAYSGAGLYAWRVIEDRLRARPAGDRADAAPQAHRRDAVRAGPRRRRLSDGRRQRAGATTRC